MKRQLLFLIIFLMGLMCVNAQTDYEMITFNSNATYESGEIIYSNNTELVLGAEIDTTPFNKKNQRLMYYCKSIFNKESLTLLYGSATPKDENSTSYTPEKQNLPTSGTFYTITPSIDGHIAAYVTINSGKPFYIVKYSDRCCLPFDAIVLKSDGEQPTIKYLNNDYTVSGKFDGTVEFDVVGGETYYIFSTGSHLPLGGYVFYFDSASSGGGEGGDYITFNDSSAEYICLNLWDKNGDHQLSYAEAAAVSDIGNAFENNKDVHEFDELRYFTGLTTIANTAFSGCSGLTSVTIPSSVTSIGKSAFSGCSGLTSVTIPEGVTSIGDSAFKGCSGLTSVTIPSSVTSIGDATFYNCSGLTSVTIPEGVTSIGDYAFSGCSGLTSVTIPSTVTSIGDFPFSGCFGLTSVIVTVTDMAAFCNNQVMGLIRWFQIHKPITLIDSEGNEITEYVIPEGVTSIGSLAFWGCSGLTSVTIPSSVTSIGDDAFSGCTGLTSVTIPEGVTSIGYRAFSDCSGLTSVTIPSSVTSIGSSAFEGCSGLTSISVESGNTSYDSRNNCNAIIETATNILIVGCNNTTIPSSVTSIGDDAFSGCTSLTSVTIPEGVTSIGFYAFEGCSGLTSVTIPEGVTSIGGGAFRGCSGLTSVTIPEGVTSIGFLAFEGCSGLTSVTIPSTVTSIGSSAFFCCSGLTNVTILEGVTSIGFSAFFCCSGLTSVTIPSSVTSIGDAAFEGCSGLTSVTIPSSVTSIGDYAFSGCSGLTDVTNYALTPQPIASGVFDHYGTLHVRQGCKSLYENAPYWEIFFIVEDADADTDGIETDKLKQNEATIIGVYDVNGKALPAMRPGINIIRYSDGTFKKVIVK